MGELHLILGPMFAGKTTKLINEANKLETKNTLVINHSSDERYGKNTFITTHDNLQLSCIAMLNLNTIFEHNISNINYIFINEGQFFPDLYNVIKKLLFEYKKIIYICGLDGDYKQQPFPNCKLLELIPYSTTVEKLSSKCSICSNKAPFTKRIINSNDIFLVGGSESYQPVCLKHL